MPYFKAKMHQIRLRLELRFRPRWGAYSAPPDRRAGFKGPTSKRKEGKGESLVYATPLLQHLVQFGLNPALLAVRELSKKRAKELRELCRLRPDSGDGVLGEGTASPLSTSSSGVWESALSV